MDLITSSPRHARGRPPLHVPVAGAVQSGPVGERAQPEALVAFCDGRSAAEGDIPPFSPVREVRRSSPAYLFAVVPTRRTVLVVPCEGLVVLALVMLTFTLL